MYNDEEIGIFLKTLRKQHGYSQEEVGSKLNLTSQAISNYEKGKRQIPINLINEFSKLYNVPVLAIMGADKDEKISKVYDKIVKINNDMEERLNNDFEVHVVGNVPDELFKELCSFVSYLKSKYGYPKN